VLDAAAALAPHRNREASTLLGDLLGGIANRILDGRESEALRARIAEIYLRQLRVVGARLDVASNASAPAEVRRLRSSLIDIVAGGAREPALRAALVRAAVEALTNPGALDTSLRARAWLVAVQAGEERVIATARTALTGSDALARRHAASALGGAREPLATTVRSLALDPAVRGGEAIALVARQFADPSTRDAALEWLLSNYRALVPKLPGYAHALPLSLPGGMCSPQAREKLDAFGQPLVREMGFGRLELDRALESIELCVALKQHHAAEFAGLAARGR
jgi:hypothetical protein